MSIDSSELNRRLQDASAELAPLNYFDDGEESAAMPEATLERLTALANEARELEMQIAAEAAFLAEKQGKLDKIVRQFIPGIMDELGMAEFKMVDGSVVTVKQDIKTSITAAHKDAAYAWLTENDYDGIIKTKVISEFGKGDIEDARMALELLRHAEIEAHMDQSIHPATLKSFVKERLENGDNIPVDVFGIYDFKEAKIKLPKKKK